MNEIVQTLKLIIVKKNVFFVFLIIYKINQLQ